MKIYTKTGDQGETSLYSGQRVKKNHAFIEAVGHVDECNSSIGTAVAMLPSLNPDSFSRVREQLEIIQHALFDVGANVATPRSCSATVKLERTRFDEQSTRMLEKWIDEMEKELPVLKTFILPGGHPAGAQLHLARSICRRTERMMVSLIDSPDFSLNVIIFLNRLSDYLFVVSRYVNHLAQCPETCWKPHLQEKGK